MKSVHMMCVIKYRTGPFSAILNQKICTEQTRCITTQLLNREFHWTVLDLFIASFIQQLFNRWIAT